jgi:Tol biopolymer transport system component
MNAIAKSFAGTARRLAAALVCFGLAHGFAGAAPSFVYETPSEFLSSGDFNGDGILDVLVLDKITGNALVGYDDGNGNLTWSSPLVSGVADAEGCAIGRFLQTTRDAVAVTSHSQNRINLVDLSATNSAGAPKIVTPMGIGPHSLVPLANPYGGAAPPYNFLLTASSDNNNSSEALDLMGISAGIGTEAAQYSESGPFDRANALQTSLTPATFAAGIVRGTNDTLDLWQFNNSPAAVFASWSNLPSGSDYAFGIFNAETLPRFLSWQPQGSNITEAPLQTSGGNFSFGTPWSTTTAEPILGVFYLDRGSGAGSFLILFTNGVEGLRFPGGSPVFSSMYSSGAGAAGNVFTGIIPQANGRFALLDAPPGASSVHAQVMHFDGTNFTQLSSGNLPAITTRGTRANVWLFLTEPFVNRTAGFIASFNTPDWSDSVTGLPGALNVLAESDGGTSAGLGSTAIDSLGAPPTGSIYGMPNQYNQAISLFSYNTPRAAEPVTVSIFPPPGIYDGPIGVSFNTLNALDKVYYRVGTGGSWLLYSASFTLTNDNTIEYYGTNSSFGTRSQLSTATYSLGINGQPTSTVNLTNGTTYTNPPPAFIPNTNIVISPFGTIFYGRRSASNTGSIWAINVDGSGDTYITTGVRPRVSRDGHWLAFMRGPGSFAGHANVWLRNLQTSVETMLFPNPGTIECYDWKADGSGLILDYNCSLSFLGTNGALSTVFNTDCYGQAPVFNPVNGRVAFHDVNPSVTTADGLYIAKSGTSNFLQIATSVYGASWPEWSPDGQRLSFTDFNTSTSLDDGTNLWVVNPSGSILNRICDFTGTSNRFPHGALWSPDSTSLIGAGTIYGTNGIWIIPLNSDRTDCQGAPTLLPTTPGDAIDFAGSVAVGQPVATGPMLVAQLGTNMISIYWSTNYSTYNVQYTLGLAPPVIWTTLSGPYGIQGANYFYQEPITPFLPAKIFRLSPQ